MIKKRYHDGSRKLYGHGNLKEFWEMELDLPLGKGCMLRLDES